MESITQDAQRVNLLFQYGVLDARAIIAWADAVIVETDSPPDALLDLSTTASDRTADILSCLQRLSEGAEFWPALRSAIPQLRDFVTLHPDRAERIANHLYLTACSFAIGDVPEDLDFIYRFDDAFSLAGEGTYGETETVYREFVCEMGRFTDAA
jgi:hypothetical protein